MYWFYTIYSDDVIAEMQLKLYVPLELHLLYNLVTVTYLLFVHIENFKVLKQAEPVFTY